jgi:hypothetical protein
MAATIVASDAGALGNEPGTAIPVELTTQSVNDVLAVPIRALLALADGGYGVEVVAPTGVHHLTAVTTGLYTSTDVEVSGAGLHAGTTVVVAQ